MKRLRMAKSKSANVRHGCLLLGEALLVGARAMKLLQTAALLLLAATHQVAAERLESLSELALKTAVRDAVEAGDQENLMAAMEEIRRRRMWVFQPTASTCSMFVPDLPVFSQHFANRMHVEQAYQLAAQKRFLEEGTCSCMFNWSFSEFVHRYLGKSLNELTQGDVIQLRDWRSQKRSDVLGRYTEFRNANCQGD